MRFIGSLITDNDSWSVEHALGMDHLWLDKPISAVVTLVCFVLLGVYLYRGAMGAHKD